jgi:hypothetical protein
MLPPLSHSSGELITAQVMNHPHDSFSALMAPPRPKTAAIR